MNSHKRRKILLDEMMRTENEGNSCKNCSGICCTFVANSMQITPLESIEILCDLDHKNLLTESLKDKLLACVEEFRLDQPIPGNGKRLFLRRTYTCPFFSGNSLGCQLTPDIKPYGCLGFNPNSTQITDGGNCSSSISLLEQRQDTFAEEEKNINDLIRLKANISWEKQSIPVALLALWGNYQLK